MADQLGKRVSWADMNRMRDAMQSQGVQPIMEGGKPHYVFFCSSKVAQQLGMGRRRRGRIPTASTEMG